MAYTKDEIKRIHQQGTAIFNREYTSLGGTLYVGLRSGRLERRDNAVTQLQRDVKTVEKQQGPIGETGEAGEAGSAGEQGIQGDTGPTGADGTDGTDATEGIKFLISITDTISVLLSKEYYIHRNYEIEDNATFTIDLGAQLCIGDGILRLGTGSTIINNGQIILT